jgi:hypothetical protein
MKKKGTGTLSLIPEFNKDGSLPEGIYSATTDEFLGRFATNSSRRKWLGQRLKEILAYLNATTAEVSVG